MATRSTFTESFDPALPHLITNVETTSATTADDAITPQIHQSLQDRDLLPAIHLVDTGYIDAELLVESEHRPGLDLVSPVRGNYRRQTTEANGFAATDFTINWEAQQVTCPTGQTSSSWTPTIDSRNNQAIVIKFARRDCQRCAQRPLCADGQRRTITVRPRAHHDALQQRRARQRTRAFATQYAQRVGIEGTISQTVRRCGIRRTRYIGLAKTRIQHLATASAINLLRVAEWLEETPQAKTRRSAFERLYTQAA